MKLIYHKGALRDLKSVFVYIAKDDADAAARVVDRIRQVSELLATSPFLGRPGRRGARFLSIAGLPYVIIYRVAADSVDYGCLPLGAKSAVLRNGAGNDRH